MLERSEVDIKFINVIYNFNSTQKDFFTYFVRKLNFFLFSNSFLSVVISVVKDDKSLLTALV